MLSKHKYCLIEPPSGKIISSSRVTNGAFLGAFAVGLDRRYEQEKFAKFCLSASLAVNNLASHTTCNKKEIDTLFKKVKIREISR